MALAQVGLGNITHVAANGTTAVYTVGAGKTAYVRALEIHNLDANSDAIVQIHVVPNNGGSAGTASSATRIARLGISTEDTYFFENAYPITLPSNGDTIQIQNEGSYAVNVLVLGDKEA